MVAAELGSYSDYSLYDGWKFRGWPIATIVRGETVMQDGRIVGRGGWGRYLQRRLPAGEVGWREGRLADLVG